MNESQLWSNNDQFEPNKLALVSFRPQLAAYLEEIQDLILIDKVGLAQQKVDETNQIAQYIWTVHVVWVFGYDIRNTDFDAECRKCVQFATGLSVLLSELRIGVLKYVLRNNLIII